MKNMKLLGIAVLAAVIGFSLIGCDNGTTPPPPVPQTVTYTSTDSAGNLYTLVVTENINRSARYVARNGDSFTFTVQLFNNGSYSVALTYSGTIDSAVDKGAGKIEISITVNGETLAITIDINGAEIKSISGDIVDEEGKAVVETPETLDPVIAVTGVTLNKTTLSLAVGAAETLTATVAPPNATNKSVTWTSNNTAVATVTNGLVTAVAAGNATITVTTADGNKPATCAVTVTAGSTDEYWSITWNLNGGTAGTGAYPAQIEKGAVLAKPSPDPTKTDNTFDGWYTDSDLTQTYNFANSVTANLNLYAKWEAGQTAPTQGLAYELITTGSNANTYRVRKGTVTGGAVVIPATYSGLPVTEIGSAADEWIYYPGAFQNCTGLTSITIPSSVTSIGS